MLSAVEACGKGTLQDNFQVVSDGLTMPLWCYHGRCGATTTSALQQYSATLDEWLVDGGCRTPVSPEAVYSQLVDDVENWQCITFGAAVSGHHSCIQ